MAQKLENMLATGERIVFRAGRGWLAAIVLTAATVVVGSLCVWMLTVALEAEISPLSTFVFFVIISPFIVHAFRSKAVLLTDQRLLYRYGYWRRRTDDVPIADIYSIKYPMPLEAHSGNIEIKRRKGRRMLISGVPNEKVLAHAIANQARLPLLGGWTGVTKISVVLGMTGVLFGAGLMLAVVHIAEPVLDSLADTHPEMTTGINVASIVAIPLLFIGGLLLGMTVVYALGLAALRFMLSPEQMQQLVCIGYVPTGKTLYARFSRASCGLAARYASWLYGQNIDCE